jgi:hypothetical protein
MTTRFWILAVAACAAGCLSEQPIASGSTESIDRSLLGSWRCVFPDEDEKRASTLKITEAEDRRLRAVFVGESFVLTAHAVKYEGGRLLNVSFEEKGRISWTVARYTLYRPAVLHVEYPKYDNDTFKDLKTPGQRSDALRRAYKAGTLFEDSFTCVRIRGEESPK